LVWIERLRDLCLFSFNPHPFPWRVGRKNAKTILLTTLSPLSILVDLVRCGLIFLFQFLRFMSIAMTCGSKHHGTKVPFFACLCPFSVLGCSLNSIPLIPVDSYGEWIKGRCAPSPSLLAPLCSSSLYACTYFRPQCSLGSSGGNRTAKTLGVSWCHLVHVSQGTLRVELVIRVLLCVAPFRCPVFCHGMRIGRSRPLLLSFLLLFHPLFGSCQLQWRTD
jgi:hypothetical protein